VRPASAFDTSVPAAWFDLAGRLVQVAGFSPPAASRVFGYAGITLFEAIVPGMPDYRRLAGRLTGLAPLPPPADPAYHWPAVANAALAAILRRLVPPATGADPRRSLHWKRAWPPGFGPACRRASSGARWSGDAWSPSISSPGRQAMVGTRAIFESSRRATLRRLDPGCGCRPRRHSSPPCSPSGAPTVPSFWRGVMRETLVRPSPTRRSLRRRFIVMLARSMRL
jgi:hypothetical protein